MSTTALVRSSSSSASLTAPTTQPQSSSPSAIPPKTTTTTATTSLPKLPSTPQAQETSKAATSTPTSTPNQSTPGRWQHPRMNEIIQRQNRTKFDQTNVISILYNLAFLLTTFLIPPLLNRLGLSIPYAAPILLLRAFLTITTVIPLLPLFRNPDPCEDIPLTPSQRNLLGLPPMSRPATPREKEQYVTPPRYQQRAATPQHGSSGGSRGGSETRGLGATGTMSGVPTAWRSASGSPVPSPTVNNNGGMARERGSGAERRKLSYTAASNRSSPLSFSDFDGGACLGVSVGGVVGAGTPTRSNNLPSQRASASVGLNSKWLYGRGSRVYT